MSTNYTSNHKILPTLKEVEILNFIHKWSVATPAHIADRFDLTPTIAKASLTKLLHLKCLQHLNTNQTDIYAITKHAAPYLQERTNRYKDINQKQLMHDLIITSFAIIFEKTYPLVHAQKQFIRDYFAQFKKFPAHTPDFLVEHHNHGEVLAVEIELTRKNQREWEKIASFHRKHLRVIQVLYITTSDLVNYLKLNLERHNIHYVRILACDELNFTHQSHYKCKHAHSGIHITNPLA